MGKRMARLIIDMEVGKGGRHGVRAPLQEARVQYPFPSGKIKLTGENPGGTGGRAFRIREVGNLMMWGVQACVCVCACVCDWSLPSG